MITLPDNERNAIASDLMPDLTPLLDVMFMLLVFFILTANAIPYTLDINIPEDNEQMSAPMDDPDMLAVTLLPGGAGWLINDTLHTEEAAFKDSLKAQTDEKKKVLIIGDKDVSIEKLLNLMTFLRKHDVETADIVMQR